MAGTAARTAWIVVQRPPRPSPTCDTALRGRGRGTRRVAGVGPRIAPESCTDVDRAAPDGERVDVESTIGVPPAPAGGGPWRTDPLLERRCGPTPATPTPILRACTRRGAGRAGVRRVAGTAARNVSVVVKRPPRPSPTCDARTPGTRPWDAGERGMASPAAVPATRDGVHAGSVHYAFSRNRRLGLSTVTWVFSGTLLVRVTPAPITLPAPTVTSPPSTVALE